MTKWVEDKDVKFTCQRDIFKYLADGNCVKFKLNGIYIYFENGKMQDAWTFQDFKDFIPMKRAEWYEDIPEQGVLCFANIEIGKVPLLVKSVIDGICYTIGHGSWNFHFNKIQPATKEEVMQYILEP